MKIITKEVAEIHADVIVNPVNCVGVMGKGLAKAIKSIYPWAFADYSDKCKLNALKPGKIIVSKHESILIQLERPYPIVIHAATKNHWRNHSKIEWVESILGELNKFMIDSNLKTIAIPKLGCGLGGLSWDSHVENLFKEVFKQTDYDVIVFDKPS